CELRRGNQRGREHAVFCGEPVWTCGEAEDGADPVCAAGRGAVCEGQGERTGDEDDQHGSVELCDSDVGFGGGGILYTTGCEWTSDLRGEASEKDATVRKAHAHCGD